MFKYKDHVNIAMLLRVVGWLIMIEALFMLIPLATAIYYNESDIFDFAISAGATGFIGLLMTSFIRPKRPDMGKREGFLLTAMVWVVFSLFGMIPFMLADNPLNISEAFFEAMSGFTTTGSSIIDKLSEQTHGILIWRAVTQWIGGMGIILFTLAVVPMLNSSGGMQMFNAEVTGITHEKLRPRVSHTAKNLWTLYFVLTGLLIFLLWLGPMSLFESVCHAFTTISTGGFSTSDNSVAQWNDSFYVEAVLTVFMFLGGVNFALLVKALSGKPRELMRNDIFRTYIGVILAMMVLFVITIIARGQFTSWKSVTIDPLFQIVSTLTSTGYTEANFENWGAFALSLVFIMMFFGACAGSTSGGAKLDRAIVLWKNTLKEIYRTTHPNSIRPIRVNGKVMAPEVVNKVIAFLCIYTMLVACGGVLLTAFNIPLIDSFFSSFSAVSNTGLGAGVTGLGGSFNVIPDAGKWILSFLMLIGRLEIFTVLILFTPGFWNK